MTQISALHEPWFASNYWVPKEEAQQRPFRYGDLFNSPASDKPSSQSQLTSEHGDLEGRTRSPWFAAVVLSPSCEVGDKAKDETPILIARVKNANDIDSGLLAKIIAGWEMKNNKVTVAFSKYAYLQPVSFNDKYSGHSFIDYTQTTWVSYKELKAAERVAALDHEARACLVRREIYYKYRWVVPLSEIKRLEKLRIDNDPNYIGPKPDWV